MDIIIKADKDTCIRKDLPLSLSDYTILAGENNSGKTTIVKAIMAHKDLDDFEKIYIPAENIKPEQEVLKNSAAGDSFYKIIQKILKPIFSQLILDDLIDKFDVEPQKKEFIDSVNALLRTMGVKDTRFDIRIPKEKFKESIIIKIAEAIVRDQYRTDIDTVEINSIGMGVQRLMVAALIQYYDKSKIDANKKTMFIIEEPEIYLHPKLKKSFHESLLDLSKKGVKILITTHDPYFIEMAKSQKIYKVSRNDDDNDSTVAKEILPGSFVLQYRSESEINYVVFGIPTKTLFLELYEYLLENFQKCITNSSQKCESCEKFKESDYTRLNKWIKLQDQTIFFNDSTLKETDISSIRHKVGHPKEAADIFDVKIGNGINKIRELVQLLKNI